MSDDDELNNIFDGVQEDPVIADGTGEGQMPSSSKCGGNENRRVDDRTSFPSDPIGSSTGDVAVKRKPGEMEGVVGTKRVRIEEPQSECDTFVEQLVAMGYNRIKVMTLLASMGKALDMNMMIDRLTGDDEPQRGQMTSPFTEPIECTTGDIMEHLENINELTRPSPLKAASFVDLCDEGTLRKHLYLKYPPSEESYAFVVKMAALMAQRLSQVNHVSSVARLSEHIFSMSDLYKHFMDRLPSEPSSGLIDRLGIVRENDSPFGVLIDVAETFVNNEGLQRITERIRDPTMSIRDIGSLCSILSDLSWMAFPRSLDATMAEAAEKMRSMMAEYSDKDIRDEETRRDAFEAARKVCKGMTPGMMTSPRYEFIERLLLCGNMNAKKAAIDELAMICDHEMSESCGVRRWMKTRNLLPVLLSDHLDHPEYVGKIGPILRKLAPVLSEREFRTVWCLQKGRGGISQEIFMHLLANLASGFQEDQIIMLFRYFKKQLKLLPTCQLQQTAFLRMTEVVLIALTRPIRPPIPLKDRQLFIECHIRLLDRFLVTHTGLGIIFYAASYGIKIADLFRGLSASVTGMALSKLAKEVNRMKELDRRFPFYYTLIHHIAANIKTDIPAEYKNVGPLLAHHNFAERSTRLLIAKARVALADVEKLELAHRKLQQKQQAAPSSSPSTTTAAAAAASAAEAATAGPSSGASSLQPSPVESAAAATAAAAVAPPPSSITPLSNGPSPKRDGSPAGTSAQVSPDVPSSSSAAAAAPAASQEQQPAKENGEERREETMSVCTPPCTPEPLRVSTAKVGSKEWEKELADLSCRVQAMTAEVSIRLLQYLQLLQVWQDACLTEEPIPGCEASQLSEATLQEMFAVVVETSKNGLHKRVIQQAPFWAVLPHSNNVHGVIRTMIKATEHQPVFRSLVSRLCATPADLVTPAYVDIIRMVTEMCFASPKFNTSTDWLDEIVRFLWRLSISKMSDVRERAVDILKAILCERHCTLRLVEAFAVARFNEAIDNFNRFSGREPLPHWEERREEDEEMEGEKDKEMEEEQDEEEEMEENGEQAVDLTLVSLVKRVPTQQPIGREAVEEMMRAMRMESTVKTREDAEFQLSRTISFVRRIITYGYLEANCPSSLVVRDRAIPGEACELTLKVQGTMSASILVLFVAANEPVSVFADRVKNMLPVSPQLNWPRSFKVRHCSTGLQWDRSWCGVGAEMGLNIRGSMDECQMMIAASPFNDDFAVEATARRELASDSRMHIEETPLGYVANETKLVPILLGILDGPASSHLQEAVLHCVQQLPLQPSVDEERMMEMCNGALSLQKPHEALFHLISLLSALLPPQLTREDAAAAKRTLLFMRQNNFVPRFMQMIREVDVISERLSTETLSLFHEVCLTLIRLFYLHDSGKHRAYRQNRDRLPQEPPPLDTSSITASLTADDIPPLLRTLFHFVWAIIAPRRIDVEREMSVIVTSPSSRLQLAKEKKVENHMNHRRTTLARTALTTMLDLASRYGSWERNVHTLFNPSSIDGEAVAFWRDALMHVGSMEIQHETGSLLSQIVERGHVEEESAVARRVLVRLVFELGRAVWGPAAAVSFAASSQRSPVELLKLAERVVRVTRRNEMQEGLLEEWIDLQIGFISEERPVWNARCHMSLHLQLLTELLKKQERETMAKAVRHCLTTLFSQALFPFAVNTAGMLERCGSLPADRPIGHGLAEGDVRRKYMDIVLYYAQETPEKALGLVDYLCQLVHGKTLQRRCPILWWEKAERMRRQRAESFCGPQLNLMQRLHHIAALRETDVRMVKGLMNPSYMCYANSVLQQLVFMPGVCEALYAIGDTEREFGDLTEDEEIKNGCLLRAMQTLFGCLLFSAEPVQSAEAVITNIELPSGANVREQQDCVEFFLTLIDKCDSAAEKFNRPPVFKRFLEGVMGYEYACKSCKHRHRGADESFTALNLEIHGTTVDNSLDHFMDGALLEGASAVMCEQCGEKRTTLKIGALRRAPATLCIQLKRFSSYDTNGGKLNSKVDVPRELDLTRFSETVRTASDEQVDKMFGWFDDTQDDPVVFNPSVDCPVRWRYRLVGVIVHSGQLGNGHYTSYVKERRPVMRGRPWFDHWLLANDDRVSVQEDKLNMEWQGSGEENTPSAYLLWYEMVEEDTVAPSGEGTVSTVEPEESTVVEKEVTVAAEDEMEEQESEVAAEMRRKAKCEWMDIGLGSLGVLEGSLLALWKRVPPGVKNYVVSENVNHQLGRDVLTESYAKFLLHVLEYAREFNKRRETGEKRHAFLKILLVARQFSTNCLWRTRGEIHSGEAEHTINQYRLFICSVFREQTEYCVEWLGAFYDPELQAISEEAREFTTNPMSVRAGVSAWWWLAGQAVMLLRGEREDLIEAYCTHMVECLRQNTLRIDGFSAFFIQTVGNPHCVEFHIKHNILPALVNAMFYYNKKTMTWGLYADFTSRTYIPIISGLFQLYRDAIDRDLINDDDYKEFVETRLHLAMGPMTRHGENHMLKMVDLLIVTLKTFGERDDSWIERIAQAILNCLKIDPHRANGLFYVVTAVSRSLRPVRARDFFDEILGKREAEAAENGLIYPGVVHMLECMLAERKESRLIQQIETALTRTMEGVEGFRERADVYDARIDAIKIRLEEWKVEETDFRAQLSVTRSMLMGAEAMGMLPLDACGPINRPPGSANGRDYEMMAISDDEMDDEDDDMMTDEEEYSESEGPVNLTNPRR